MLFPQVAKKSFDQLNRIPEFLAIVHSTINALKKLNSQKRAKFIHKKVDEYVKEVFEDPMVKKLSPCKAGCSACCHTQVSVTKDEAELLSKRIAAGLKIDFDRLSKQASTMNDVEQFFKLSFNDRKCIFLDDNQSCSVYADRPSVCRTNAVLGSSEQCDTTNGFQTTRLVLTKKADMVVYASFYFSDESGALPYMMGQVLSKQKLEHSCSK
jgi:Fe-S-cluster containining protein